jgi:hypothetical protein
VASPACSKVKIQEPIASTTKYELCEALQTLAGEPSTVIATGKPELAVALMLYD